MLEEAILMFPFLVHDLDDFFLGIRYDGVVCGAGKAK
jgi:hypothetical protein